MTPHWHAYNPWADRVVYVPIERLAECVAGGTVHVVAEGVIKEYSVEFVLEQWGSGVRPLDAYILPQPQPSQHSIGVRWGKEGGDYFSPHNAHPDKTQALLDEFKQ